MRIIAGSARGRPLLSPKGLSTRPTLDRVKESLFNILQFQLAGARILDLYAGSGNLGLEALSRGADFVVFNDHSRDCCGIIQKNLQALHFADKAQVLQMDALCAIHGFCTPFDIVFLDPPYDADPAAVITALFDRQLVKDVLVLEHAWDKTPLLSASALFTKTGARKYGDTGLSFFAPRKEESY